MVHGGVVKRDVLKTISKFIQEMMKKGQKNEEKGKHEKYRKIKGKIEEKKVEK